MKDLSALSAPLHALTPLPFLNGLYAKIEGGQHPITPEAREPALQALGGLIESVSSSYGNRNGEWLLPHPIFDPKRAKLRPSRPDASIHRKLPIHIGEPAMAPYLGRGAWEYAKAMEVYATELGLYKMSGRFMYGTLGIQDEISNQFGPHFQRCNEELARALEVVDRFSGKMPGHPDPAQRPKVVVMGVGGGEEHNVAKLAERYRVVLVDLNRFLLEGLMKRLPEELRPYVSGELQELTGGGLIRFEKQLSEPLDRGKKGGRMKEEMEAVMRLLEKGDVPVLDFSRYEADLIISSLLVSQLTVKVTNSILNAAEQSGIFVSTTSPLATQINNFKARVHAAHTEALRRSVTAAPNRVVLYISDINSKLRYQPLDKQGDFYVDDPKTVLSEQYAFPERMGERSLSALFYADPNVRIEARAEWKEGTLHPNRSKETVALPGIGTVRKGYYREMNSVILTGKRPS